ncbi:MAG: hypothetical protein AAGB32_00200 [Pseudomonadota bacterium]
MSIIFIDNQIVTAKPDQYLTLNVDTAKTLKSWKNSLFSFEWLTPDGKIRSEAEMADTVLQQYQTVRELINKGDSLKRPVLGVGLIDNVEIGSGKDVFLTLASENIDTIEVHISKKDQDFFESFKS